MKENIEQEIKDAVYETYNLYGKRQASSAIFFKVTEDAIEGFTRQNGAREKISQIMPVDFKEAIINIGASCIEKNAEKEVDIEQVKEQLRNKINNTAEETYAVWLRQFSDNIAEYIGLEETKKRDITTGEIPIITEEMLKNLKRVQAEMITGLTPKVEGDIELDGTCYASTSIGKVRENQEDAVILVKDEQLPEFKMLVVADGMGGTESGELASSKLVNGLKYWFENLNETERNCYFTGISGLEDSFNKQINEINDMINISLLSRGGTTFTCAIIGKEDTLIANVGDSRAYIVKDGKLEQVSEEDSVSYEAFKRGEIPTKDAIRFHSRSNEITQCVGCWGSPDVHFNTLNNKDYDMILLFSDGVTDCLSEEEIAIICRETDKREIYKKLVGKALETTSLAPEEIIGNYKI